MAIKAADEETDGDIPAWLMTFSDVITLLMTFFILLLTFASNEPQTFQRIQVTLFSGGGASGVAGQSRGSIDQDSVLMRERPRSGRITQRGAEMPPINSDPAYEALSKGINGLEDEPEEQFASMHLAHFELSNLIDSRNQITAMGQQWLGMIALQIRQNPIQVCWLANKVEELEQIQALAQHLFQVHKVPLGKVAIGKSTLPLQDGYVKCVIFREQNHHASP